MGIINFFRCHIPQVALLQVPLTDALSGNNTSGERKVAWTEDMTAAFQQLKTAFTCTVTLAHPIPDAKISITTDTSDSSVGTVLHQHVTDNSELLHFFSKKLTSSQRK